MVNQKERDEEKDGRKEMVRICEEKNKMKRRRKVGGNDGFK